MKVILYMAITVNGLITGISLGPFGGAALGSFGVILRELKDQFQKNP